MEDLFPDLFHFIWRIICLWWAILPGAILEAFSWLTPTLYERFSKRFLDTPEKRTKFAHQIFLSGFIIASFFAYHDANNEIRAKQAEIDSANVQLKDLDEQWKQLKMDNIHLQYGVQHWHDLYFKSNPKASSHTAGFVNTEKGHVGSMDNNQFLRTDTDVENSGEINEVKNNSF